MDCQVLFARAGSVAQVIERMLQGASTSVDAALYRLDNLRLAHALEEAFRRGIRVRLILDRGKYEETRATQELLAKSRIPFRLLAGRQKGESKMHHKFAVLDKRVALTGSYNWTVESEKDNYENLLILREPELAKAYHREFEALWRHAQ